MRPGLFLVSALLLAPLGRMTAAEAPSPVADADLSQGFHVYAFEWTPKELNWYFDGKKIRTLANTLCHPEQEVLLGSKVAPFASKASAALEGKSMDVDYVRIYQNAE